MVKMMMKMPFIKKIINQIIRLLKNKIIPFYVFDGKPSDAKDGTLLHRLKRKNNFKNKIKTLEMELKECDDIILKK